MCKLTIEFGRIRAEVDVQEAVGLLGRDVVEALQGLHGVGRADLLEEGL
jgi:hypothetical protein